MNPKIAAIASYEDKKAIREFLDLTFRAQPELYDWLRTPDSSRLIVLKPNWIQESHEFNLDSWEPVATHPAILLATAEYLCETMGGQGTICVCDAPNTYVDFSLLGEQYQFRRKLDEVRRRFPRMNIEILDLRREIWTRKEEVIVDRRENTPDPRGYVQLNLGRDSMLFKHTGEGRYYGADYDRSVVNIHHMGDTHEYLLAGTAVKCDLFVNLPKLKTHKKVGLTCSLKNLVGINGDKNWLPHFSEGCPKDRGDEFRDDVLGTKFERSTKKWAQKFALKFPRIGTWIFRKIRKAGKKVLGDSDHTIRNGNWCGNDTCWRMVLDLNRALLYGNPDGSWREGKNIKRYISIIDGIVGGEGNGPLCPDPVASNVLVSGNNPAEVDAVACMLMGFDHQQVSLLTNSFEPHRWQISSQKWETIQVEDGRAGAVIPLPKVVPAVPGGFRPHFGWPKLNLRKKS